MSNPLDEFASKYRKYHDKKNSSEGLLLRIEIIEERLNQIESALSDLWDKMGLKDSLDDMHNKAIQNLRDDLTLTKEAVGEHIRHHEQGTDIKETQELILEYRRKLRILRQKEAQYGSAAVPVNVLIDIEETEKRIAQLQEEL